MSNVPDEISVDESLPAPENASDFVLSALLELELNVAVSVGRSKVELDRILRAGPGTVLKLNKAAGDEAELLVHGVTVARGEVISVGGRYGFKVSEVVSLEDRLHLCQA